MTIQDISARVHGIIVARLDDPISLTHAGIHELRFQVAGARLPKGSHKLLLKIGVQAPGDALWFTEERDLQFEVPERAGSASANRIEWHESQRRPHLLRLPLTVARLEQHARSEEAVA